jgi:hypothetical protein
LAEIVDQFRKNLLTHPTPHDKLLFINEFFFTKKFSQKIGYFLINKQLLFWPKHCNPCCNNYYKMTTAVIWAMPDSAIGRFTVCTIAGRLQSVSGKDYESND